MSELLACRVCLATDVKLYNIRQCGLTQSFQTVIGCAIPVSDGFPQHLCCFCIPLLRKYVRFKSMYLEAQHILTGMVLSNQMVTTESLRAVHHHSPQLSAHRPAVHRTHPVQCGPGEGEPPGEAVKAEGLCKREVLDHVKSEVEECAEEASADDAESDDVPLARAQRRRGRGRGGAGRGAAPPPRPQDLNIEVVALSKAEQIAAVQARRSSANYLSSPLKCERCFKGFLNDTTYRNHMELHNPSAGAHACDVCATRFATARKLSAHARAIHASRYVCRLCSHAASSSYQARLHQKWHEGVTYDCDICGKSFSKLTTRLTHVRLAHGGAHGCARCGLAFLSAHGLQAHRLSAHRTPESAREPAAWCEPCAAQFASAPALALHRRTSSRHAGTPHGALAAHCPACGESFPGPAALRSHRARHRAGSAGGARTCAECGVACKDERAYAAHYRRAHRPPGPPPGNRPIAKPRNYVCELCGTKCSSNATLAYHQRVHSGEKPHACARCPRRFRLPEQLQIHMRGHTGERPFACGACPKAFVHKAALNRHVRVHTGAKPYRCAHCAKAFSQSNSLKLHVRCVHLRLPPPRRRPPPPPAAARPGPALGDRTGL